MTRQEWVKRGITPHISDQAVEILNQIYPKIEREEVYSITEIKNWLKANSYTTRESTIRRYIEILFPEVIARLYNIDYDRGVYGVYIGKTLVYVGVSGKRTFNDIFDRYRKQMKDGTGGVMIGQMLEAKEKGWKVELKVLQRKEGAMTDKELKKIQMEYVKRFQPRFNHEKG